MNRYLAIVLIAVGAILVGRINTHDGRCEWAFLDHGLTMKTCPSGVIRQTAQLEVSGVRRSADASVAIRATAHYTVKDADAVQTMALPEITEVALSLVDAKGKATPLSTKPWKAGATTFKVPEVPDGDYKLHATYKTRIGDGELDAAIPLYTPARVHVMTDRPLYEPGNTVKFRAVVLRARDLAPLDGRPGRWVVKDPNGEVLLEEKAPATDWGVVAGSFPLDRQAQTGDWHISWESADAVDDVTVKVEPFKLPRFRVEANADKAFYRAGDKPTVKGAVIYSSGAPVAKAKVEITWDIQGEWPPPLDWQEKTLPKTATTGENGRFELALPVIPKDLQGQVTLAAKIAAIDPAGDRVEGSASVLLSEDGITVSSVTELGNGLVEGFNNRLYVRVATPDGQVVRKAKVTLKRSWEQNDKGIEAELDEDGVASLQIDPGAPVNITIPALPYRPQPKVALVTRDEPEELIGSEGASLADQVEMDKWLVPLGACAKWYGATGGGDDESGATSARIGMRVDAGGGIGTVGAAGNPLAQCVAQVVRGKRLPPGNERMYTVSFNFEDPEISTLGYEVHSALDQPEELAGAIGNLAKSTRDCLPRNADGDLGKLLQWRVTKGSKEVQLGPWITVKPPKAEDGEEPEATSNGAAAFGCVSSHIGTRIALSEPFGSDGLGYIDFTVTPPETASDERPQPTTKLGYELTVIADIEGKPSTKLRIDPGEIPNVRLRVTPILAKPGDKVTVELIRGPGFSGKLPKKLTLTHLKGSVEADLDDDRKAVFAIDDKIEGWAEVQALGTRALVFVKPKSDLVVSVEPEKPRYKPGDQAQLAISTKIAGKGGPAAVGLFGVDASLGQLVSLPGPDSMGRLQPKVETGSPAFGMLDGQALTLGRIRGPNAAAATVLRVSAIPKPPELDAVVNASAATRFDPIEELTDHFYIVLAELHLQARAWESKAPATEKMKPATMARLWVAALDAAEKKGEKVTDAYGRRLTLSMLPGDLLALTDPRVVVVVGTRLPEDTENWSAWVAKEKP